MTNLDRMAIRDFGIPSLTLMENAGRGIFLVLAELWGDLSRRQIHVVCGRGNNGGDGLVIARCLQEEMGLRPEIWLTHRPEDLSEDAAHNWRRLDPVAVRHEAASPEEFARRAAGLSRGDLIVDALLGTGITGAPRAPYPAWIAAVNASPAAVLSVDLPSGMDGDRALLDRPRVVASVTATLGLPKRGLVCHGNVDEVGRLVVVKIGIPDELLEEDDDHPILFRESSARALLPRRSWSSTKWDVGRVLVVAGSREMRGAGALVANGAVRAGAGLVQLISDGDFSPHPALRAEVLTGGSLERPADAVVAGPGLGVAAEELLTRLLAAQECPMVLDADMLDPFALNVESWHGRDVVLTPHIGEFARMIGAERIRDDEDRMYLGARWAEKWGVTLLLKGARTLVIDPSGRISVNGAGNPWMASGGMGDTLAGIIGALIAQGLSTFDAARLGAWLHAAAADDVLGDGVRPITASDVAERLPYVWERLALPGRPSPALSRPLPD